MGDRARLGIICYGIRNAWSFCISPVLIAVLFALSDTLDTRPNASLDSPRLIAAAEIALHGRSYFPLQSQENARR
ncbi:hypothetical protein BOTBODRAFT_38976 [Botryobasidium botryosum FD-172 SS1]|uniref:Uncharacterized protein n=1 Tax=Botryobasidium botryosum (strain FD-172 SS1) TaxID=930990 RepID=A0A067LV48_BOTB1|nr:hypothetical protein BOTBODRAFT_38976 [Botryobasidium botryosum FD-172 SS1]